MALLHLAPRLGDFAHNRSQLEAAVLQAAGHGAAWVLTPELCLSGYQFASALGTDWIRPQPDPWMLGLMATAGRLGVTIFLGQAERDPESGLLHNTVFVIGPKGELLGRQRKLQVVPGAEAWAAAGQAPVVIAAPPLRVGVLICADAYTPRAAGSLREQGAELLVSSAAWAPWPHGPEASWEGRSRDTGLPVIVCNRTGQEGNLDFRSAESAVVREGRRRFSHSGPEPALILVDWDLEAMDLAGPPETQAIS